MFENGNRTHMYLNIIRGGRNKLQHIYHRTSCPSSDKKTLLRRSTLVHQRGHRTCVTSYRLGVACVVRLKRCIKKLWTRKTLGTTTQGVEERRWAEGIVCLGRGSFWSATLPAAFTKPVSFQLSLGVAIIFISRRVFRYGILLNVAGSQHYF